MVSGCFNENMAELLYRRLEDPLVGLLKVRENDCWQMPISQKVTDFAGCVAIVPSSSRGGSSVDWGSIYPTFFVISQDFHVTQQTGT